jgi:VanZ family protein
VLPAYWVCLFTLTHLPKLPSVGAPEQSDKLAHLATFGLLAFLYWRFFETFSRPRPWTFVWISAAVLLTYAALDEYLQQFVGRGTDIADWLADAAGIGVVLACLEWRRRRASPSAAIQN